MTAPDDKNLLRDIVPSPREGLAKYGSELVRRGLDDLARLAETKRPRVLVVNEDTAITEALEQVLTANGYEVRSTYSASEAIALARSFRPHVAILAFVIAETNCIQLGRVLTDFLPRITVVFTKWLSSEFPEGFARDCARYDFDYFAALYFPIETVESLLESMKRWVDWASWSPAQKREAIDRNRQQHKERLALKKPHPVLDLIIYCRQNGRVCPQPEKWDALYEMLPDKKSVGARWEPDVPLISGSSSDSAKRLRLAEHIAWAHDHRSLEAVAKYLFTLPEEDWHYERPVDAPEPFDEDIPF